MRFRQAGRQTDHSFYTFFSAGPHSVFLNGEDMSSTEDLRKWTVDDVYNFINNIPSCSEYSQVNEGSFHCSSLTGKHVVSPKLYCCQLKTFSLPDGCCLQTFKDHMIDGETLPLLTEEHLLDTLGLKLGPALKIRSQVPNRPVCFLHHRLHTP